ncbi:MAG: hypothetical protein ABDH28_05960, partial [Brevinematia bacterium]
MQEDKDFEEIEIEQIDLDIDKSYDITVDISSVEFPESSVSEEKYSSVEESVGAEEISFTETVDVSSLGMEGGDISAEGKKEEEELTVFVSETRLEEEPVISKDEGVALSDLEEME